MYAQRLLSSLPRRQSATHPSSVNASTAGRLVQANNTHHHSFFRLVDFGQRRQSDRFLSHRVILQHARCRRDIAFSHLAIHYQANHDHFHIVQARQEFEQIASTVFQSRLRACKYRSQYSK